MTEEKRRFSRIGFQVQVEAQVGDRSFRLDRLNNVSIGGCQLNIAEPVAEGTACRLCIILNPADRRQNVEVVGEVVRSDQQTISVRFTAIEPEDLQHLQNIIRYNAPDPDRIESEIDDHPGLL